MIPKNIPKMLGKYGRTYYPYMAPKFSYFLVVSTFNPSQKYDEKLRNIRGGIENQQPSPTIAMENHHF